MSLICIEGPNGSGKTSLINEFKRKTNYKVLQNPGTTELGKLLRPICRGINQWEHLHISVRSLLFSATRNDLYDTIVNNKDIHVIDRWWMSTFVYQICLGKLPIENLECTLYPNEKIDLVILLDGKDDVLLSRVDKERSLNPSHGHDKWTKEKDTIKKIIGYYRKELPEYLRKKDIPNIVIDTSDLSIEDMFKHVNLIISDIQK